MPDLLALYVDFAEYMGIPRLLLFVGSFYLGSYLYNNLPKTLSGHDTKLSKALTKKIF